ncbi:MAG: protein kinase [Gemmataceae bacterium]
MPAPSSVEELLKLVRDSGLVGEPALVGYLDSRAAGQPLPADPRAATSELIRDGLITNFQAEQFLLGKWRGFTIGKYKLLERVGVGGMGQVFLCEHQHMKRRVAVKVLPPAKAEQPAALGRFYREARAAGALEHPNIVRTHDIDQDGNLHFIVMEYVDGTNLLDVVKRFGRLGLGRATSYVRQVAAALQYAFENGIVHRDVKPGNILIDRDGTAKILDMGLARFYKDQTDNLTVKYDDKVVLGTADYVAPEQVADSHSADTRSDIYSLGATYYFLLAGHTPFPTGTVSQKLLWHRTKEPTPIEQVRPEVPHRIAAVIARMLAKNPADRFQTPGEVAAALDGLLPDDVPLPAPEEMPQHSPAATGDSAEAGRPPTPPERYVEPPRPQAPAAVVRPGPFAPSAASAPASPYVKLSVIDTPKAGSSYSQTAEIRPPAKARPTPCPDYRRKTREAIRQGQPARATVTPTTAPSRTLLFGLLAAGAVGGAVAAVLLLR